MVVVRQVSSVDKGGSDGGGKVWCDMRADKEVRCRLNVKLHLYTGRAGITAYQSLHGQGRHYCLSVSTREGQVLLLISLYHGQGRYYCL